MQQSRPIKESKVVKHVKNMSEGEKFFNYNLLTCKYKLNEI